MYKWAEFVRTFFVLMTAVLTAWLPANAADKFPGIGRMATGAEIAAWDIDVRPDFKGLPAGSGTVAVGQEIWDQRCASCHGTFAESNEIFTPIVGGTTKQDIERGRVASLTDPKQPQRTTVMKVATLSSLFDYIYRAMPWNAPRSLTADETYALLAHILNLAEIVPDSFSLSNLNIAEVQQRMPNRFGMTTAHGLWNARGKPDVKATACMQDCAAFVQIGSVLPEYARNAHNNLAEQNRPWGPYRGVDTTLPPLRALANNGVLPAPTGVLVAPPTSGKKLFAKHNCSACHRADTELVGPALRDIAKRYQGKPDAVAILEKKIRNGGAGVWGNIAMPAHDTIRESDIASLVSWILEGKF